MLGYILINFVLTDRLSIQKNFFYLEYTAFILIFPYLLLLFLLMFRKGIKNNYDK
jgi:hypothetical protein